MALRFMVHPFNVNTSLHIQETMKDVYLRSQRVKLCNKVWLML